MIQGSRWGGRRGPQSSPGGDGGGGGPEGSEQYVKTGYIVLTYGVYPIFNE